MQPTVILKRRAAGLSEPALARYTKEACRVAGVKGAVTVLVTSAREMRLLNSRFRGKRAATDVLSFAPSMTADGFAGDIAISLDLAKSNSRRLGHSILCEVRILVLHGILHLAGYDHEEDSGEMAMKESRLRRRLGLPESLTERGATASSKGSPALRNRAIIKRTSPRTRVRP